MPIEFPGATPAIQLADFQTTMMAKSSVEVAADADVIGRYRDRKGNRLQCAYAGDDQVNGQKIDYGQWPSQENPWVKQPRNGNLTITKGKSQMIYDVVTVTISAPMPVSAAR